MAFSPIAFVAPNYRDYKNYWLKAYEPGTTTPKSMALDKDANVIVIKAELNKDGFIVSAGGTLVIPYINGRYDLWLYPDETSADNNTTVNAVRVADNMVSDGSGDIGQPIYAEEVVTLTAGQTLISFSGISANRASIYVGSESVDRGRLINSIDYTVTSDSSITLKNSYPAGAFCVGISDEIIPTATVIFVKKYDTMTELKSVPSINVNDAISLSGRNSKDDGGGSMQDVYASGTYPVNFDVVSHDDLSLQFKIRDTGSLTVEAFGAGTADDTPLFNFFIGKSYRPIANGEYNVTSIPADITMYRGCGFMVLPTGEKVPMGEDFKQSTINAVRPIPDSDLSWVPFFPKVDSVGNVTTTEGVNHYAIRREAPASVGEVWVDPVNGLDTNAGSVGLPIKTLTEAFRVRTSNDVYMMGSSSPLTPAVFEKSDFRDTDPVGNRLKNVIIQGHCKIAEVNESLSGLSWTNESGQVYKATTSTIELHQLRYTKALDDDGGFLKVKNIPFNTDLATTITDVNNSLFGWYHDIATNTLYVRIGSGDTFKSFIEGLPADINSRMLFLGTAISFYTPTGSSLVFDGVYLTPLISGTTRPRLYMHSEDEGAIQINNSWTHGVDALGAEYYLQNIKSTSTSGDNFHGFDSAGVGTLAVEVNCDSSFAGDFGTKGTQAAGTDNGSAMHGNGHVARFGGKYYKNYGPDVVDSGTGAFWNCGVEAFGSTLSSNAIGFDITAGAGRMYLDTCLARDEDLDEIQVNAGAVLRTFNTTGNVTEVSTGKEYAYNPLKPI